MYTVAPTKAYVHVTLWLLEGGAVRSWFEGLHDVFPVVLVHQNEGHLQWEELQVTHSIRWCYTSPASLIPRPHALCTEGNASLSNSWLC